MSERKTVTRDSEDDATLYDGLEEVDQLDELDFDIEVPELPRKREYVNKQQFLEAIIAYKAEKKAAYKKGLIAKADLNKFYNGSKHADYLGQCVLLIAQQLAYHQNFVNYSYRDDMIGDAIENCLVYFDNFDPQKSSQPFSYFTSVCWWAFVRRVKKEKKQSATKARYLLKSNFFESYEQQAGDERAYENTNVSFLKKTAQEQITNYESSEQKKKDRQKQNRKKKGLELVADDE